MERRAAAEGGALQATMKDVWVERLMVPLMGLAIAGSYGVYQNVAREMSLARVSDVGIYQAVGARVLSYEAPMALVFEDMVSEAEASHIIGLARPRLEAAHVVAQRQMRLPGGIAVNVPSAASSSRARDEGRSNTLAWLDHDASPEIWSIVQRIANRTGIPSSHAERIQVIRYEPGQECKRTRDSPRGTDCVTR